jgi:phosphomannomutase/phosphoglucomutase
MENSKNRQLFGTNGVRGIANTELTPEISMNLGRVIGSMVEGTIAVGMDARISSSMLKNALIAGVLSTGSNVVDLGLSPTPAIQYYVKNNADAGVIITASHNPKEYNGVKFIQEDGTEFTDEMDRESEKLFFSGNFKKVSWDEIGQLFHDSCLDMYVNGIVDRVDSESIKRRGFTVVVDGGNGVGSLTTPSILKKLGCRVISINCHLDGMFPGRQPEPEEHALNELKRVVREIGAELGVAHDGDADRAVFVDEKGNFIREDVLLALLAREYVNKHNGGVVVIPISTSKIVEDVVKEHGGSVIYTRVGSPTVAKVMKEEGAVFGGEGNGGLIFPEHQYCRDGGMAVAKILEMIVESDLSSLVSDMPSYYMIKEKIPCENRNKVMEELKNRFPDGDFTDGVRLNFEDGWVLIRPSGTEPLIRIFAESMDKNRAKDLLEFGKREVSSILS